MPHYLNVELRTQSAAHLRLPPETPPIDSTGAPTHAEETSGADGIELSRQFKTDAALFAATSHPHHHGTPPDHSSTALHSRSEY
mmetsp:Transcript_53048/g.53457  ORF Transcript_53048/g.53457 Transcript_53048/m.53457 type:complete len:84 (-) Transcript_53048:1058-1309(-)